MTNLTKQIILNTFKQDGCRVTFNAEYNRLSALHNYPMGAEYSEDAAMEQAIREVTEANVEVNKRYGTLKTEGGTK